MEIKIIPNTSPRNKEKRNFQERKRDKPFQEPGQDPRINEVRPNPKPNQKCAPGGKAQN